jgi:hypothetical protein
MTNTIHPTPVNETEFLFSGDGSPIAGSAIADEKLTLHNNYSIKGTQWH